jgi:hypothetical protein
MIIRYRSKTSAIFRAATTEHEPIHLQAAGARSIALRLAVHLPHHLTVFLHGGWLCHLGRRE